MSNNPLVIINLYAARFMQWPLLPIKLAGIFVQCNMIYPKTVMPFVHCSGHVR